MEISPSTGSHQTCLQERGREPEKSATPGLWQATKREKRGYGEVHMKKTTKDPTKRDRGWKETWHNRKEKGGGGRGGSARNEEDGPHGPDWATTGHDLVDHATPKERKEVVHRWRSGGGGYGRGNKGVGGWGEGGEGRLGFWKERERFRLYLLVAAPDSNYCTC
jgi:hypothetical protein